MSPKLSRSPEVAARSDFDALSQSFRLALLAQNKSKATVYIYTSGVAQFREFLAERGMPLVVAYLRREHVESFIADLLTRRSAATANNRYRCLQSFFKWLQEEGEIPLSPMAHMACLPDCPERGAGPG